SRRRHTRLQGDWSSDVCSSDLRRFVEVPLRIPRLSVLQVETPSVDQRSGKVCSICARTEAAQSPLQQLGRSAPPAQFGLPLSFIDVEQRERVPLLQDLD